MYFLDLLFYIISVLICIYSVNCKSFFNMQGAFGALQKICEDLSRQLEGEGQNQVLNVMIPKFLHFFKHNSPKLRY